MQRMILLVLTVCILAAVLCGCAGKNEDAAPAPANSGTQAAETQEAGAVPEVPDPEATAFASAASLALGVRQARETAAQERTEAQNVLAELDEIYAPDADFAGFELLGVEAQEDYLVYYYMPADGPAYDGFDYRRGITVTVCTDPSITLAQVCGELGLEQGADGFTCDAEHNQLFFSQDGLTCSLQAPEGTDPETMKGFCRLTTIPLN